jgi:hypothetical protein
MVVKRQQARSRDAEASETGVVVVKDPSGRYATITFAEKPAREILDALRAGGFRWHKGSWSGSAENIPESIQA